MIKGLTPNIAPMKEKGSLRVADSSSSSAKKTEKADFADQLFGAKSGKLEGPESRNERKDQPGRVSEGKRSVTRENSQTAGRSDDSPPSKTKPEGGKAERKTLAKKDSPKSEKREAPERPVGTIANREPVAHQQPMVSDESMETSEDVSVDSTEERLTVDAKSGAQVPTQTPKAPVGQSPTGQKPTEAPKLPDFFSKSALAGGAAMVAPVSAQEQSAAQADSTAQMLLSMQDQETVARQNAMAEFLNQMQDELGVPPEKVLQAFSEMDLEDLTATPQNSVGAFVEGLDLEPAGQVRAAELYKNLLDKRGDAIIGGQFAQMGEGVNVEVSSPRDVALQKLDKSLTELNASFFRKDGELAQNPEKAQMAMENMDAQLARLMRERAEKSSKKDQNDVALMGAGAGAGLLAADAMEDADAASLVSDSGDSVVGSMSSSSPDVGMPKLPNFSGGQASSDWMSGGEQSKNQANAQSVSAPKSNEFKDSVTKEMKTIDKETTSLRGEKLATESSTTPIAGPAGQAAAPASKAPLAAGATMMMGRQPTAGDEQQNIREMVRQAQVMLKRGGGEMKIQMTPEGMGQVHLKVAVENGQVNVQMLTESDSAKRLIEKGLGDLKTSLAAHQLKVENVRVDVGQDIQKHMDQQAGQEQARNFAREFMQQQRDERQDMRQGAFAMRGMGSYGGNKRAPLEPESVSGMASARSRSEANGSGRSLNLVA